MRKKSKNRSIFNMCCPCFGKAPVNCDEFVCSNFGKEFTEFEYVIENLAIRRAPKKLLDAAQCCPQPKMKPCDVTCNKRCGRDFSGYVCKKAPAIACGPVIEVDDILADEPCYMREQRRHKSTVISPPTRSNQEPNCSLRSPSKKAPCPSCNAYFAQTTTELDDSMITEIMKPQLLYEDVRSSKMKVSADIHKVCIEEDKPIRIMPTEIKETIDALKMAKPLHLTSETPARNHRSLLRSLSATSCDKETFCNFTPVLDPKAEGDSEENVKEKEEKLKRFARLMKRTSPPKKPDKSSPSTSESIHFPDIIECDEVENSDLQTTEGSATTPERERPPKAQTLKWRIIINKHKKR